MLEIENLSVAYGGLTAVSDVSVTVGKGEFVAIVGPNGAGKTTLFKAISGVVPPRQGRILFEGQDLLTVPAYQRAHMGIAHVPEGRQVFPNMSVADNLSMGAYTEEGQRRQAEILDMILSLFPVLAERSKLLAGTLSGGEQQMLAIGRGLACAPRLLMLDEPSMGLAPAVADMIFERIIDIRVKAGLSILLVEQRVAEALESCDRGYVLETGKVVLQGPHQTLLEDKRIRQAYLGM